MTHMLLLSRGKSKEMSFLSKLLSNAVSGYTGREQASSENLKAREANHGHG